MLDLHLLQFCSKEPGDAFVYLVDLLKEWLKLGIFIIQVRHLNRDLIICYNIWLLTPLETF